jgi:hypothetical protein
MLARRVSEGFFHFPLLARGLVSFDMDKRGPAANLAVPVEAGGPLFSLFPGDWQRREASLILALRPSP